MILTSHSTQNIDSEWVIYLNVQHKLLKENIEYIYNLMVGKAFMDRTHPHTHTNTKH